MRKLVLGSLVVASFVLALSVGRAGAGDEPKPRARTIKLSCKLAFPEHKPGKALEVWIPLPPEIQDLQSPVAKSFEGKLEPGTCDWQDEKGRPREVAHAKVPATDKPVELTWTATVERREQRTPSSLLASTASDLSEKEKTELGAYLKPELANPMDESFRKTASDLAPGEKAFVKIAHAAYEYVLAHMKYDKPKDKPGWGKGSLSWACSSGFGNCTDFHALFMNLCRARGIPARFTMGFSLPKDKKGEVQGYHCWCEFYVPSGGWVPVDASEAWKHQDKKDYFFGNLDEDRVSLVRGRDLTFDPKQKSGPVSILSVAYAEEEGTPISATRELRYEDVDSK